MKSGESGFRFNLLASNGQVIAVSQSYSGEDACLNGIKSVRQRITLLKDHTSLTLEDFKALVRATLCQGERVLTPEEVSGIEQLELTYLKEEFINRIH